MKPHFSTPRVRRGFTLTEVLVSVPLMVLIFWIVGQIFTTTRETVNLGMVHSKVTASAESAVQRIARDLTGLRPDGRLLIAAYRLQDQPLDREDVSAANRFPQGLGHIVFISQLTAASQTDSNIRGNVARIHIRPALRQDSANNQLLICNTQALVRDALLYVYDTRAGQFRTPTVAERPNLLPGVSDVVAFPPTRFTLTTGTVDQPRTNLVQEAVESMRTAFYNDTPPVTPRFENQHPITGGFAGSVFPFLQNTNTLVPGPSSSTQTQLFYQQLMLARCSLVWNGPVDPATGTPPAMGGGRFPPAILGANDPIANAALRDPGAVAYFQWWGVENVSGALQPENWHPNITEVPTVTSLFANDYYLRRFMTIRTPQDLLEYNRQTPYGQIPLSTGGANPNRSPNAPDVGVPWPLAIRANFMVFDRVGRFREGALFQAVIDVSGSR